MDELIFDNSYEIPVDFPGLLSQRVKGRLEAQLNLLYANQYCEFLLDKPDALLRDKPVDNLLTLCRHEAGTYKDLKAAWSIWLFMHVHDRHFILNIFYQHMNILTQRDIKISSTAIFCEVFIREFAPILSAQLN